METTNTPEKVKGFKVTNSEMKCREYQFKINETFKEGGKAELCNNGFHFCIVAAHCFNYYDFTPSNRVFEVEVSGDIETGNDKSCGTEIYFVRELTWEEVLKLVNTGIGNSGLSNSGNWNSGDSNSGYRNSGNWNSGDRNSGDSNSGYSNSGDRNSGDSNSGYRNSGNWNSGDSNSGYRNSGNWNSGNWNSGDRNSGDSNSGYRNSGAFSTDSNPELILFNKASGISVKDWERSEAVSIMNNLLDFTLWIPSDKMTDEEKKKYPKHETTDGYLKTISIKEAWANLWGNLKDDKKKIFTSLPNFSASLFEEITGIKSNS